MRARLTPHQREVYDRIARLSRRRPVDAANIGSVGACARLVEKGYVVEVAMAPGPRGGSRVAYRAVDG